MGERFSKRFIAVVFIWLSIICPLSAQTQIIDSVLYITEGATQIGSQAYYGKTTFKKVVIPSSVTKIGSLAFHSCTKLEEIDIPASVTTIGNAAFQNDSALTKVTLHEGLTNLSYRLFKGTAITEITIPSSVTEFDNEVFSGCDNLATIKVDKYTDAHAFFCTDSRMKLTDNEPAQTKGQWIATAKYNILDNGILYVGSSVTKINDKQYDDNDSVIEIRFSESLEKIGYQSFRNADGLTKVVIPGNVKLIGDGAFAACKNLEEVVFEEGVEQINVYAFYSCPNLISVTMPLSLQKINPDGLYWQNKSTRVFHCYAGSKAYNLALKNNFEMIDIIGVDEQNIDSIAKLVCTANKTIQAEMFQKVPAEIAILSDITTEIGANAFHAETKLQVKQNSYANKWAIENGYFIYDIDGEYNFYTKDKSNSFAKQIDISPNVSELTQFVDNVTIRVKRNTYADTWAKQNGYYLCGVLADLNVYTKDASKQIEEDFTRILCDDAPYAEWTSCSFNTQHPLKLEEIDGKLVLTSYMLYPCENVTVTDKDGKSLISNKTIYPLTRTVLCDFVFFEDSVENYNLTTDDAFYQRLVSIPVSWNISFNRIVRRTSPIDSDKSFETMRPVYAREFIPGIFNVAYIIGSEEYEKRCYEAVENKTLVTDEALTIPLTKEQMEKLLKKTKSWSLTLGRDNIAGVGGGNILTMSAPFILQFSHGKPSAFWHEFSHCMGWAHEQGNMCYLGRPEPYDVDWPSIGSLVYQEEYKKGTVPYIFDSQTLNSKLFSNDELNPEDIEDDTVMNGTLYITEGMPRSGSHKTETDFTKVVFPSSIEIIDESAFRETAIQDISIPSSVVIINKTAFQSCQDLKTVDIPNSVKTILDAAFQNCTSLTSVEIPNSIREISYRLFKASGLTEITIPSTVKVIGKEAFADCKNLKKVVIEDGVRKIDNNAFYNTGIDTIEIPESVIILGKNITSKGIVWKVKYGSAAYYAALENNYPIELLPETEENIAAKIIADSENAVAASTEGWQADDFTSSYERRTWDFSSELKGAGTYTITFKYTSGSNMLCLADALFTADGNPVAFFAERRTAGFNPSKIVYEITVPAETENLMLYALAKTGGGTDSKGTITVSYQPSNNGNGNGDDNGNGNGDDNGNGNGDDNGNGNGDDNGNGNGDDNGNGNGDDNGNGNGDDNGNGNGNGDDNGNTETAVNELNTEINIYVVNHIIVVENATDEIFVYDSIGRLIARRDAMHCVSTIIVRYSGVYVVRIGNLAKKVIVE